MISAPLRTPETTKTKPSLKTHGHLALLDWDEEWDTQTPRTTAAHAKKLADPVRRSALDRCYDGGILVLMAVTVAALAVSLGNF